jgi:hypothetical protein
LRRHIGFRSPIKFHGAIHCDHCKFVDPPLELEHRKQGFWRALVEIDPVEEDGFESYVRPLCAALMAAGPDDIRGLNPIHVSELGALTKPRVFPIPAS